MIDLESNVVYEVCEGCEQIRVVTGCKGDHGEPTEPDTDSCPLSLEPDLFIDGYSIGCKLREGNNE